MIREKVTYIRLALKDYFEMIEQLLPSSMFASDATRNGIPPHMTSIPIGGRGKYEGANRLPYAISINFATSMQRYNADYFLTDW